MEIKESVFEKHSQLTTNRRGKPGRFVLVSVLSLVIVAGLATSSRATGNVVKSDLVGPWALSVVGNTGCGIAAMQATFTLNSSATGTATLTTHAQCGDSVLNNQTFTVETLAPNGSGTANLTCGTGCGWNFNIQVTPDRSTFSVVDVSTANPNNFLQGVAIHR